ncbi:ANK [Lepeophtheirus salmonis]|uniref:ANK n=1 Tax=Lepeophtheirus salmonis TaxID=72036 RepID=A0A7R8H4S8_LEPSM|nr:ANK [Lepeophtheirus salmonis]CAF2865168.1 ANK [Lepeophtheirus salmonis]
MLVAGQNILRERRRGLIKRRNVDLLDTISNLIVIVVSPFLDQDAQGTTNASFLRAARGGNLEKVLEYLKQSTNINSCNANGLNALHLASKEGHVEIVSELLSRGSIVDAATRKGNTALHIASLAGQDAIVKMLVDHDATVNLQSQNASGANQSLATEDGFTPLAVALQQGHDQVVTLLLESDSRGKARLPALHIAAKKDDVKAAGLLLHNDHNPDVTSKKNANVNFVAKHNITPLHVAAKWGKNKYGESGHENVVELMIQKGAPISAKTKNGLAPLHMSSQGDHVDAARVLIHYKAPVDEVTVDYLTALHVAAHCGHVRVAKLLLDCKADPNSRALNGFTPLHIACKKNRIKLVELLLKYGASIESTTESGLTPLHVASFMGCMNIVIYLLQHQAGPDDATVRGETPLHLAARANQTDIIRILLRNGAKVDAQARELQTPLHIASRLGNIDIVVLLLQSGAQIDSKTKDLYTALHIAAKEGQEEVASVLLDHSASRTAPTKKGFTPLHLAAKYGNKNVCQLLLQKQAPVNCEGKNGVTPLHVASHYDHPNVAILLLDNNASPHAVAKNGYTPLHISSKKNQLEITQSLLEFGADTNAMSKAGFTPLHLASQEGHKETSNKLIANGANVNAAAKNGLTPLHLCAQEDSIEVAEMLTSLGADMEAQTKQGYSPLHVASHFGSTNMVKFLLEKKVDPNVQNGIGYTALHQASQQGHPQIVNMLLSHGASPNSVSNNGQTPLSIAQRLGYISVVETLKVVTEQEVTTTTTTITEEKYKVISPEAMQETFFSDSEDDGCEETMVGDHSYKYLTVDEMKSLGDDSMPIDVTHDEKQQGKVDNMEEKISSAIAAATLDTSNSEVKDTSSFEHLKSDNIALYTPVYVGFLVSFMVDARVEQCVAAVIQGKDKLIHPPPLMEGEAIASRILELGPTGAKFFGVLTNGENPGASTPLKQLRMLSKKFLQESFDGDDQLEDLNTNRITRILTTDFPQYFAIVSRIRQEVHAIGPEGGVVNSSVVPQSLSLFGNRVAVSPIVTVEPRRRKFHKPITLTMPVPTAVAKGMINSYTSDRTPTLRLLCSITGGTTRAQWEDVTGSTPLTFINDCVNFTTTVSARFWLIDCRNVSEVIKMATELYREAIHVPFMAKFLVYSKRQDPNESSLRVFCITDDKEDKTLESQEHFIEVAKSRDVEVLEGKLNYLEFGGNLVPVSKSGQQFSLKFNAFKENRLPFVVRVKDTESKSMGRVAFMRESKTLNNVQQTPICNLNLELPETEAGYGKFDTIHKADLRISDIGNMLGSDWVHLAHILDINEADINIIKSEYPENVGQQAMVMLRLWLNLNENRASGNELERGLHVCGREDIIKACMFNVEMVTDNNEKTIAQMALNQVQDNSNNKKSLKEEVASSIYEAEEHKYIAEEKDVVSESSYTDEKIKEDGNEIEKDEQEELEELEEEERNFESLPSNHEDHNY